MCDAGAKEEPPPSWGTSECKCSCSQELKELEDRLNLAGRIGTELVEANNDLQQQLQDITTKSAAKIEALEQERYSLERRLEQREHMEGLHADEAEGLRQQLAQRKEDEAKVHSEHANQLQQLKRELSSLQSELDKCQLSLAQSCQENKELDSRLKDAQNQLEDQRKEKLCDQSSEDLALLEEKLYIALHEKAVLEEQLAEKTSHHTRLQMELEAIKNRLHEKETELEEVQRESTSYYNTLQQSREEVSELKVELDLVRMEAQRHEKKGNSLFAEVEDRRMEAEKELISLKVQHAALTKQQELTRDHLHKLKVQMASLLQMCGGRAATRHAERLEQQLAQARSQIQALANSVPSAKRLASKEDESTYKETCSESMGDDYQVQFFRAQLKEKEKELSKCQAECRTQRLLNLSESQKLVDIERRLYTSEQQCESLTSQLERAKLSLAEMRLKYEPEKVKSKPKEREFFIEKIPLSEDEDEAVHQGEQPQGSENILQVQGDLPTNLDDRHNDDGAFWERVRDNVQQKRPLESSSQRLEGRSLRSLKVKKVTMSDSVDIYNDPQDSCQESGDAEMGEASSAEAQVAGPRVRAGKRCHNVVKVGSAQKSNQPDCKMQ